MPRATTTRNMTSTHIRILMEVTVDRISSSGNPIARAKAQRKHVHVPDGKPGETYVIKLYYTGSYYVGIRAGLSDTRKEEIKNEYESKHGHKIEQKRSWPKERQSRKPTQSKRSQTRRTGADQKEDTGITYGGFPKEKNKNELLNGKL